MSIPKQKKTISISLNPTYFCNLRCGFCYLTEKQLSDKSLLTLEVLYKRLAEINHAGYQIGHVDLYGGEILLLPYQYIAAVKKILRCAGATDIEIITNLTTYQQQVVEDDGFGISVSYDFDQRQQHEHVMKNMLKLNRPFTVLTLGIPELFKKDPAECIETLNMLSNCRHWEIKPYSPNQSNQFQVPYTAFEEFVQKVIEYPNKNFKFINEDILLDAVEGHAHSYSDDHVYITPNGKFGVLEFDSNDNEYFQEVDTFQDYLDWTVMEKSRVLSNQFCGTCQYSGRCISEHLREVKSIDQSCNGFYKLIKWYDNRNANPEQLGNAHW